MEVRNLAADSLVWVEHSTFGPDELAVRFHHRLVAIHPFPNGNGRHSRVCANYLAVALGAPPLSWGANLQGSTDDVRSAYIVALRKADAGEFAPVVAIARS